jgi:epoxide hydrolase
VSFRFKTAQKASASLDASHHREDGTAMDVRPFTIAIPDAEVADLYERLDRTRWPAALTEEWSRGTPVSYAQRLARYWRDGYDWRTQEARLNRMPQFMVEVDGQPIHGLHVRSARDEAVPLLLLHGYPSSFVEFAGIAPMLADPHGDETADATAPSFHVVAPSIPGFGFSTPLTSHGWDIARTAKAFDEIMQALGYDRYAVFGEDVGAGISEQLCLDAGDHVLGSIAATDPGAIATAYTPPTDHLTDDEREHHERLKDARTEDFGYLALQTTRPLSVAYGLVDSPIAQATWIVEKFQEWTDPDRALPEDAVDLDDLLTLVTVAWFGRNGDGAANALYEAAHAQAAWGRHHDRPQGMAAFGDEPLMRRILDPDGHLAFWNEHPRGGHFPAMEAPADLVGDIRAYFARLLAV